VFALKGMSDQSEDEQEDEVEEENESDGDDDSDDLEKLQSHHHLQTTNQKRKRAGAERRQHTTPRMQHSLILTMRKPMNWRNRRRSGYRPRQGMHWRMTTLV